MKKIYVLDTSVYLTSANAIYAYQDNDILIPIKVLEEIDQHKKRQDVVGSNARQTIRILDGLRAKGSLKRGVRLDTKKGMIKVVMSQLGHVPQDLDSQIADNKIISCVVKAIKDNPKKQVVLVSRDINMRVIANSIGIRAEDYAFEHVLDDTGKLYSGTSELTVSDDLVEDFYDEYNIVLTPEQSKGLLANQFVKLISNLDPNKTALTRFLKDGEPLQPVKDFKQNGGVWKIKPRNSEQAYALDLLMDPKIPIVSLVGRAGSGKTLCAIAAGLEQVLSSKTYKRMIVSRPIQPVGKDIGFLPGTLEEKMLPWLKPIQDNLEFLMSGKIALEEYMAKGIIELEAISYIRGRSIADAFIIIDEAQNLTRHELKTIITRVGEGTKIVLTGDVEQIDSAYISETSNGLSYAVEKFKPYELAGHVSLMKGERSAVATLASEIL